MNILRRCAGIAVIAAVTLPAQVFAESTQTSGAGTLTTDARLDFSVTIPQFLRFRVGTAGATIDQIDFTVPAANVGDGTDIAGVGGDLGAGVVTVQVSSNAGQITITENNNSAGSGLGDGGGNFLPYTEILTASSDPANLDAPVLSDAGGNSTTPTLNAGGVTSRNATWTYTYDNTAVYTAGIYGTLANGGRVTYTASSP